MNDGDPEIRVTTVELGPRARAIVLRGRIDARSEIELRRQLLAAIDDGVHRLLLDLSATDSITSSTERLVRAASVTMDDRGGALLAWRQNGPVEDPSFVLAELRDQHLGQLVRVEPDDAADRGRP